MSDKRYLVLLISLCISEIVNFVLDAFRIKSN